MDGKEVDKMVHDMILIGTSAGGIEALRRIASPKTGSSRFLVKVTSKMKLSPGIQLDVVIDQFGLPDDSPKTWMNPKTCLPDQSAYPLAQKTMIPSSPSKPAFSPLREA